MIDSYDVMLAGVPGFACRAMLTVDLYLRLLLCKPGGLESFKAQPWKLHSHIVKQRSDSRF